jgi:hypothetical protein
MQVLDRVELFTSVSGQAGPGPGGSQAYSWTDGGIYLMNFSESEDYYVDLCLDWEYSVSGPANVVLGAVSFYEDYFYRSVLDEGLPLQDSGRELLQLCVPAGSVEQLLILADAEGEVTIAPVPLPGALLLGSLGMVFAGCRLRRGK